MRVWVVIDTWHDAEVDTLWSTKAAAKERAEEIDGSVLEFDVDADGERESNVRLI